MTTEEVVKTPINVDDVPISITAELGRTKLKVSELKSISSGSIIELNEHAGDFLKVYANGKLIANGEVIVVNEKLGIRITEIF